MVAKSVAWSSELREVFEIARRYLEGAATIHELNGAVSYAKDAAKFGGSAQAIFELLDNWSEMIDRRWNEWGHRADSIAEAEFVSWLRQQLPFDGETR